MVKKNRLILIYSSIVYLEIRSIFEWTILFCIYRRMCIFIIRKSLYSHFLFFIAAIKWNQADKLRWVRVTKANKKNIDSQTGWLIHCWIFIGLFCCQIGWTMPKIMKRSTFFYGWASLSENINQSATEAKCMRNQIVVTTLKAQLILCYCRYCSCWW